MARRVERHGPHATRDNLNFVQEAGRVARACPRAFGHLKPPYGVPLRTPFSRADLIGECRPAVFCTIRYA